MYRLNIFNIRSTVHFVLSLLIISILSQVYNSFAVIYKVYFIWRNFKHPKSLKVGSCQSSTFFFFFFGNRTDLSAVYKYQVFWSDNPESSIHSSLELPHIFYVNKIVESNHSLFSWGSLCLLWKEEIIRSMDVDQSFVNFFYFSIQKRM